MEEFFDYIRIVPFPFIVMGFMVIACLVIHCVHDYYKTRLNNELKQTMLDRGMSAQEIELVMNAGKDDTKTDLQATESSDPADSSIPARSETS